jgi:hypothetical protein
MLQTITVGRGPIYESERQALAWLLSRQGTGASVSEGARVYVKRVSKKAFDLAFWCGPGIPGEAWSPKRNDRISRFLVSECLEEFEKMGLGAIPTGSSYGAFCAVVVAAAEQNRALVPVVPQAAGDKPRAYVGEAYFEDDGEVWPARVTRAVKRFDGLLIQLSGQIDDGSHYTAEANLPLQAGMYRGTATMKGSENTWSEKAEVAIRTTWTDGAKWELAGEWVEKGEGPDGDYVFAFELELETTTV